MREIFYEESVRLINEKTEAKKFNTYRVLSIIFYSFAFVWFIIAISSINLNELFGENNSVFFGVLFMVLPFALFIGCGILFGQVKKKFYVEYDYTLISGNIRIAKVIKNYKRKQVLSFDTSAIERLGHYDSETYNKYEQMPGIKRVILTSNRLPADDKSFYYLVVNCEGEKKLLIIECTQIFLVNIMQFAKRTIIEEGFSKQ